MGLVFTPVFRIVANDKDITDKISERLIELSYSDESGDESDMLEIHLSDADPKRPINIPETGAELKLSLGYKQTTIRDMGTFVVDEVELSGWPGEMTIRARAATFTDSKSGKKTMQSQKTRSWAKGTKLSDIAKKIASEQKLKPAISASMSNIVLPHVDQTDESDLNLLIRLARKYDGVVKVGNGKLILAKHAESKTTSGEKLPTVEITANMVSSWRWNKSKKNEAGTVTAFWHDVGKAKRQSVTVGSGDPEVKLKQTYANESIAKAAANSDLNKRARSEVKFSFTMPGDPNVKAEAKTNALHFREGVDGEWLNKTVRHRFDPSSGYSTEVDCEKPS